MFTNIGLAYLPCTYLSPPPPPQSRTPSPSSLFRSFRGGGRSFPFFLPPAPLPFVRIYVDRQLRRLGECYLRRFNKWFLFFYLWKVHDETILIDCSWCVLFFIFYFFTILPINHRAPPSSHIQSAVSLGVAPFWKICTGNMESKEFLVKWKKCALSL